MTAITRHPMTSDVSNVTTCTTPIIVNPHDRNNEYIRSIILIAGVGSLIVGITTIVIFVVYRLRKKGLQFWTLKKYVRVRRRTNSDSGQQPIINSSLIEEPAVRMRQDSELFSIEDELGLEDISQNGHQSDILFVKDTSFSVNNYNGSQTVFGDDTRHIEHYNHAAAQPNNETVENSNKIDEDVPDLQFRKPSFKQ